MSLMPIAELEMTINRCRQHLAGVRAAPGAQKPDPALEDLAVLAGVYGMMIFTGQSSLSRGDQSVTVQSAIARWAACCSGSMAPNEGAGEVSAPPAAKLFGPSAAEQCTHGQE
jgi:hypothetical protein